MEENKVEEQRFDPKEVERQMVQEELDRRNKEPDPLEIASMMLTLYTPRFCALVDQLSSRQLKRLVKALVEYPVGREYSHRDKLEAEAAAIGHNLLDAKAALLFATYHEHRDEIIRQAEEAQATADNVEIETVFGNNEETKTEGSNNG